MTHTTRLKDWIARGAVAGILLAATVTPAGAGTMGSAMLLTSNSSLMDCFITNIGTKTARIISAEIRNYQSLDVTNANHCVTELAPGETCTFNGITEDGQAIVQVQGSTRSLRGQCQFTSAFDTILGSTELR